VNKKYTVTVNIKPKVKARPRMTRRGRVFTPKTTLEYERAIADAYLGPRFEGPVAVDILLSKDKVKITIKETDQDTPTLRGDVDNYAKSILDGLNGVAYVDDKQVRELRVRK